MDAAAELGRNHVSKQHFQPEYGDEQADAGRDRRTRLARPVLRHERGQGNIRFPCPADHEQDWQPYPIDPYSDICVTIHHTKHTNVILYAIHQIHHTNIYTHAYVGSAGEPGKTWAGGKGERMDGLRGKGSSAIWHHGGLAHRRTT